MQLKASTVILSKAPTLRLAPFQGSRRSRFIVRAQTDGPTPEAKEAAEESRVEVLEASLRAKKGANKIIESRKEQNSQSITSNMPKWKEGALFPEGWDEMDPIEKATNLYMGERGFLYWANQAAWFSIIGIGVAWVVFRFIGPTLHLYQLSNDISTPNL